MLSKPEKIIHNYVQTKESQYEQEHETRIIQLAENSPNNFWKIFKSKRSQKAICQACPVILQNHFTNLLSKDEVTFLPSDIPNDHDYFRTSAEYNRILDNRISLNEKCLSIKNINPRKSAGIDNISAKALPMSMPLTFGRYSFAFSIVPFTKQNAPNFGKLLSSFSFKKEKAVKLTQIATEVGKFTVPYIKSTRAVFMKD